MSNLKTSQIALLAVLATFMTIGVTTVFGYSVEESTMCYGYSDTTLSPLGSTSAFLTTHEEAGVWIKISNPPDQVTFKFYYTEDNIEKEYTGGYSRVDIVDMVDQNWGIAFTTMDVSGSTPGFKPGLWTCKAYIDGDIAAIINFNIIDYNALSDQIAQIGETVQGIVDEKNEILENYNAIVLDYEALVEDYNELEDSTVSETQLYEINRQYDDLEDQYDELEASQASTKMMMYAAIVVALVAVIVAVYFGVMKK